MKIELNKTGTIKISKTRSSLQCVVSRRLISEGEQAIKFMRYHGDDAYGGVWVSYDFQVVEKLKEILKDLEKNYPHDEYVEYCDGVTISKYSPKQRTIERGKNCLCSVSNEKIEKGEYTLSLSENHSANTNNSRVKTEYIDKLRTEILNWGNIEGELEDEQREKQKENIDNSCNYCGSLQVKVKTGGHPELGYEYLKCQNCGEKSSTN